MVHVAKLEAAGREAVVNGVKRERVRIEGCGALVVLLTSETLFLGRGHHLAITHEASRRIVERGIDSQDGCHEDGTPRGISLHSLVDIGPRSGAPAKGRDAARGTHLGNCPNHMRSELLRRG